MEEMIKKLLAEGTLRRFPASDEALTDALGFVEQALEDGGCAMKIQMSVAVVVEEIFVNIAHYAYEGETGVCEMTVAVGETEHGRAIAVGFKDEGFPFNPLAMEDPDVSAGLEERGVGGLGVYMVKKMTDAVSYEFQDGKNHLMFMKYF